MYHTLPWASCGGRMFLLTGGTQTWSGLLCSQESAQDASVVPVHRQSWVVFLPWMLCLDLVVFTAGFEVTFRVLCCIHSYGAWLDCPHCPMLLHSSLRQPQSHREVAWTWTGFKLKLSGIYCVSGYTHLRPALELQHPQWDPFSQMSLSQ